VETTLTSYLGLTKPNFDGSADIRTINADLDILDAATSRTVLTNPGFEVWSRGVGPFATNGAIGPDRWQLSVGAGSTLSVARDTGSVDVGSRYDALCTYTNSVSSTLYQTIEDYAQLRGRTVTFTVRVNASVAQSIRLLIWDSAYGFRSGAFNVSSGAYETLSVSAPIAFVATSVQVHVQLNQTQVTAIDNATLQLGAAPVAYAPLHPTEDLARCQRYYWYVGGDDAAEIVGHGMAVSATQVFGWLKFPVQMAGVPTMTVSAPALWGVMGAAAA
jgi:hypothetical protein